MSGGVRPVSSLPLHRRGVHHDVDCGRNPLSGGQVQRHLAEGVVHQVHDGQQSESAGAQRTALVLVGKTTPPRAAAAPVLPNHRLELHGDHGVAGVGHDGAGVHRGLPAELGADREQRVRGVGRRAAVDDARVACESAA